MRSRGTGALGDEPASVTGTSLDKGVELDALAKERVNDPKKALAL
jgi:hypothetical protein